MIYNSKSGVKYSTSENYLAKGGEGHIFSIVGKPNLVAKILFENKRTETRHRKIQTMLANGISDSALKQVAWPTDILYHSGQFVGYVMPAISNSEDLNVIYSDKYKSTLYERIIIAKNICAAINAVHNANQVCGDLNPKNIVVNPKTLGVYLVDTDSFHITDYKSNNRIYRCEAGLPEYLPREVQEKMMNGNRLDKVTLPTFTKYSDLFALAVHIFALLMNGCHPFAYAKGTYNNIGRLSVGKESVPDPNPQRSICEGFFPFYMKREGITIPMYAPPFDSLPKYIRDLFVRAFVDGHSDKTKRPTTVEWYKALSKMQEELKTCKKDKVHMYSNHLNKCPWCEVQNRMNTSMSALVRPGDVINNATNSNVHTGKTNAIKENPFEKHGMFWFLTILISMGVQAAVHLWIAPDLINMIFANVSRDNVGSWAINLATYLGPWGLVIFALIGLCIYNYSVYNKTIVSGVKGYHYLVSIIVSVVSSAVWIGLAFLLYAVTYIVIGIIILAIIGALFGGG